MSDDARKLLDSLMGSHRNVDRKEAKAKKGQHFKGDDICKLYLIGFCPQYEALFHNTKRDLGECKKVHSDAMKEEFEAHPERDRYQGEYERKLKQYLDELVRCADEWTARERRNIQDSNRVLEESGPNEVAQVEIKRMLDNAAALLVEAEDFAGKGLITESKKKVDMSEEMKKKAMEWEEKAKAQGVRTNDDVCDICGSRRESGDVKNGFHHNEGKVHMGYVRIREMMVGLKKKIKELDEQEEKSRAERGEKRRDRSRSRDRERRDDRGEPQGEPTQERSRHRQRDDAADEQDYSRARRGHRRSQDDDFDREPPRGRREDSRSRNGRGGDRDRHRDRERMDRDGRGGRGYGGRDDYGRY